MQDARSEYQTRRLPAHVFLSFALLLLALGSPLASWSRASAAESKIDKVREKIEEDDKKPDRPRSAGRSDADSDDADEDSLLLKAGLMALCAPFWLPPVILDDHPLPPCKPFRFEAYPYKGDARGALRMAPAREEPSGAWGIPEGDFFSFRAAYTFERDSSDMLANRGELLVRSASRFNLDASATDYAERIAGATDHLQHYQAHLTYTFAASERALFAAGAGVRSLHFEDGYSATGIDFRYEAEFYPVKPLHLHLIAEAGQVRDSTAWELEARSGVQLGRFEVFAGYRHFRVAEENFAGPILGVAVVF